MKRSAVITFILAYGLTTNADSLSFKEVWQKVRESSPAQEGARLQVQSAEAALSRANNHWLPRIYIDAKTYQTNDPGSVFFGQLEQRKIEASDFSVDTLNHPDTLTFTRGALGLDLPLYEGGMKKAQVATFQHVATAEKFNALQIEIEQYAQSSLAYGSIASIQKNKAKLKELNEQIAQLLKGYQLGQKSNPVGYSGLLGMKSLANRIAGLIEFYEAQEKANYSALKEMGVRESNWIPQAFDARNFVNQYLKTANTLKSSDSFKTQARNESTQAAAQSSNIDKARYLPRVGAFAETYTFNGNRDTASGYTAGVYLQWNLFDPSDYGKYKESKLKAMAIERFNRANSMQENAQRSALVASDESLRANLARLDESDKLLSEQIRVSSTLFKNGSINALQFVEILNRRTDLITQQSETEISLLRTSAEQIQKTEFNISDILNEGAKK